MPNIVANQKNVKVRLATCHFCELNALCVIGDTRKVFVNWVQTCRSMFHGSNNDVEVFHEYCPTICLTCLEDYLPIVTKEAKEIEKDAKRKSRGTQASSKLLPHFF